MMWSSPNKGVLPTPHTLLLRGAVVPHSASTHGPAKPLDLTGPPCIQALPFHWQYHFWAAGSQNAVGNSQEKYSND